MLFCEITKSCDRNESNQQILLEDKKFSDQIVADRTKERGKVFKSDFPGEHDWCNVR